MPQTCGKSFFRKENIKKGKRGFWNICETLFRVSSGIRRNSSWSSSIDGRSLQKKDVFCFNQNPFEARIYTQAHTGIIHYCSCSSAWKNIQRKRTHMWCWNNSTFILHSRSPSCSFWVKIAPLHKLYVFFSLTESLSANVS